MKTASVEQGIYKIGSFTLSVQLPLFQEKPGELFEVFLTEHRDPLTYYIDLHEDARFGLFQHLKTFSRKLTLLDLEEYNAKVQVVASKLLMPTWKLSRETIVNLFDQCYNLTKRSKK